jgi:shikimate kinase/3-dehydroquinate synthase
MTSNIALLPGGTGQGRHVAPRPATQTQSIVLVGLMGAGKSSIGRRIALRLGLPFRDADQEIEQATGCSIAEFFERHGEPAFREGERKVIKRLISGPACVLATGGGAFMDAATRATIREHAISVWLRCRLATLVRRTAARQHRPLLRNGDPEKILAALMAERHPIYGEADIVVDSGEDSPDTTAGRVLEALGAFRAPRRVAVALAGQAYDVVIGDGLISRAGALLAPVLPQKRAVVVADETVATLYLPRLIEGLQETGFEVRHCLVPAGEASKSLGMYGRVTDALLEAVVERQTAVIALGGGVVGDLAGFAAATTLRGLPFVQVPTTLLAQVDSSVGGKTGLNTGFGKNLLGAFHQPRIVLADTAALRTLPGRELLAGYAEIIKAGLIADAPFYAWCEANGPAMLAGDAGLQAAAIERACAFKARVVTDDEREEKPDGRALLNLGHSFAHALEAEYGYGGGLLHGEAVALGLGLAFRLSVKLDLCAEADWARVTSHIASVGLPAELGVLNRRLSAARLIRHMRSDKKMRDGRLAFILVRGIGAAFSSRDVPEEAVVATLRDAGCEA